MQAAPGQLRNRGKPLPQIRLERLQPRHSGRPGTIDRRLEAAGNDLANGLAVQPSPPGDRRHVGALPMQIEDHDNLSKSNHRLPPSLRGKHRQHSAARPPLTDGLPQPARGIFSRHFWGVLQRHRQWGACWLACRLYEQLELDRFWAARLPDSREGTCWRHILETLVCYRLIDPGSEWRLHRLWFEQSAMGDLL